jgi:tripartite-type tricarboxylate transporter receptor subunit TctC
VHPSLPAKTVRDLVALAKARPGQLNYASSGSGSSHHLSGELFKLMSGTNLVHVPYKGTGPAITDAIGGHVEVIFSGIADSAAGQSRQAARIGHHQGAAQSDAA